MGEAEKGKFMHFKMWLCKSSFLLAMKMVWPFSKNVSYIINSLGISNAADILPYWYDFT